MGGGGRCGGAFGCAPGGGGAGAGGNRYECVPKRIPLRLERCEWSRVHGEVDHDHGECLCEVLLEQDRQVQLLFFASSRVPGERVFHGRHRREDRWIRR
ncbi:hypothetical protein SBRY_50485 [Actinacidiphila bryophytorum]|uniref:Uncharacterized protein n=1 Tax=Actinacidiphila bryophytorum TaxID=1436133 RepID=A0A9W4MEX8_9ACTN|nr:hypothetical protein SBRY_50485 [Actinacidiphila bryophytorum]